MASKAVVVIVIFVGREGLKSMADTHHCLRCPGVKVTHIISINSPWEDLNYLDPCTARRAGTGST